MIARALRARILGARGERGRALAHATWAVSHRAIRDPHGFPQVAARYVADGIGCSISAAHDALREFTRLTLSSRTPHGYVTTTPEAIAACFDVTLWAIDAGIMVEPEIRSAAILGPPVHVDLSRLISAGRTRGKITCPCGGHAHGDRDPSLLVDLEHGNGTCMVSRARFRISLDGFATPIGKIADRTDGDQTRTNAARGVDTPTDRRPSDRTPAYLGATLPEGYDPGGRHLSGRLRARHVGGHGGQIPLVVTDLARSSPSAIAIGDVLTSADRSGGGPKSRAKAERAAEQATIRSWAGLDGAPQVECPDRFWSLERMVPASWETFVNRRTGAEFSRPTSWTSLGSDLVLLDLDGLTDADTDADPATVRRLRRAISAPRFRDHVAGAAAIVGSSRTGLQVTVRLRRWRTEDQLAAFFASPDGRAFMRALADVAIRSVRRGGAVDESAWATGRWARRPGWRAKAGRAVRATLWWSDVDAG